MLLFLTLQKFAELKNKESFKAWLISIAKNKCNDYYRKNIAASDLSVDELPEGVLTENRYKAVERGCIDMQPCICYDLFCKIGKTPNNYDKSGTTRLK